MAESNSATVRCSHCGPSQPIRIFDFFEPYSRRIASPKICHQKNSEIIIGQRLGSYLTETQVEYEVREFGGFSYWLHESPIPVHIINLEGGCLNKYLFAQDKLGLTSSGVSTEYLMTIRRKSPAWNRRTYSSGCRVGGRPIQKHNLRSKATKDLEIPRV